VGAGAADEAGGRAGGGLLGRAHKDDLRLCVAAQSRP
jgi:hypothetical protein